jgi:hypothetical protein
LQLDVQAKSGYRQAVAGESRGVDRVSGCRDGPGFDYHGTYLAQSGIHLHKEEA